MITAWNVLSRKTYHELHTLYNIYCKPILAIAFYDIQTLLQFINELVIVASLLYIIHEVVGSMLIH